MVEIKILNEKALVVSLNRRRVNYVPYFIATKPDN